MTEVEWRACTDPHTMLEFLGSSGKISERKARLFAVAVCRRIWPIWPADQLRKAGELAERFDDGLAKKEELTDLWPYCCFPGQPPQFTDTAESKACQYALLAFQAAARKTCSMGHTHLAWEAARFAAGTVAWSVVGFAKSSSEAAAWASRWNAAEAAEFKEQASLIGDICGNAFRPVKDASAWITPDVLTLAGHVYYDRGFDQMPELADTLGQAGCTEADILAHCRQPAPHVRGCWVVDLILGKR